MSHKGFLAIWCEMDQADLKDYRNWITQEHIADRTPLPGWLGARFCIDIENECAHFFLYATEGKHVFSEAPYLDVLNTPSPWTKRLMPKFGPFDRALGEQLFKVGNGFGGYMLVSRIKQNTVASLSQVQAELAQLVEVDEIVSVRLMKVDRGSTDIPTQEKTMRQGLEGDFDYLLIVEVMSEQACIDAKPQLVAKVAAAFGETERFDTSIRKVIYGETSFEMATA